MRAQKQRRAHGKERDLGGKSAAPQYTVVVVILYSIIVILKRYY